MKLELFDHTPWVFFPKFISMTLAYWFDKWYDLHHLTYRPHKDFTTTSTEFIPTTTLEYENLWPTTDTWYNKTTVNRTHWKLDQYHNRSFITHFSFKYHCRDFSWWHSRFSCVHKVYHHRFCKKRFYRERCPFTCQNCAGKYGKIIRNAYSRPNENKNDSYGPPVSVEEKSLCQKQGTLAQVGFDGMIVSKEKLTWKAAYHCCWNVGATLLSFVDKKGGTRFWKYMYGGEDNPYWVYASDAEKENNWWWQSPERDLIEKDHWYHNYPNNINGSEHCGVIYRRGNTYLLDDRNCMEKHKFLCRRKYGVQNITSGYHLSNLHMTVSIKRPPIRDVRGYNFFLDKIPFPHVPKFEHNPVHWFRVPRTSVIQSEEKLFRYKDVLDKRYSHTSLKGVYQKPPYNFSSLENYWPAWA